MKKSWTFFFTIFEFRVTFFAGRGQNSDSAPLKILLKEFLPSFPISLKLIKHFFKFHPRFLPFYKIYFFQKSYLIAQIFFSYSNFFKISPQTHRRFSKIILNCSEILSVRLISLKFSQKILLTNFFEILPKVLKYFYKYPSIAQEG